MKEITGKAQITINLELDIFKYQFCYIKITTNLLKFSKLRIVKY